MNYTGGDIKRLGYRLRDCRGKYISDEDLDLLQAHRLSFTQPLFKIFKELIQLKSGVQRSAIIAFRLKRITTIIDKVIRKPDMQLNRMWDIAGIRIIFSDKASARKMVNLILENYEVRGKVRDYFEKPKKIGYQAFHIYITDPVSGKVVEVQIRTRETHNWATLVEITDVLYNTRLKEEGYENNVTLGRFHQILSSEKELGSDDAEFLFKTLDKYDFITKLAETFRKNSSVVKKQWQEVGSRDKFFLIELSSDSIPKLTGYKDYDKAELDYFNAYKKDEGALIVLTSIHKPSFEQISIAYANYILSYHTFIKDVQEILKTLAVEKIEQKKFKDFRKIFRLYENIQANNLINIFFERDDVILRLKGGKLFLDSNSKISSKKKKEIRKTIRTGINQLAKKHSIFIGDIDKAMQDRPFWAWRTNRFLKKHEKRMRKRLKSIDLTFE